MSKVLILVEGVGKHIKRSSQELLQASSASGQNTLAVLFGSAADCAVEASQNGASEIHTFKDSTFDQYNPEQMSSALAELIKTNQVEIFLGSSSSMARDLFPRLAARLGASLVSDATSLSFANSTVTVKKPLYAGKCFAEAQFLSPLKMILMRPNQLPVAAATGSGDAKMVEHASPAKNLRSIVKEIVKGTSEKMDLTEANIIVSGGRGLKEANNFKMLQELADVLGATVGASRAVVDQGWVPHDMQVGQTGKTVAPSLYIAVGISGAIQHLAGMSGSKVIVAINNDPSAAIFQKATYGIVGDAFEVVPLLIAEFKKALK